MGKIYANGVDFSSPVITRGVAGIKGDNNDTYKTGYVNMSLSDLCWNYSVGFGGGIDNIWKDTPISGEMLKSGFYIVQAIVYIRLPESITGQNEFYGSYAGMMNWRSKTTPDLTEEIILNFSGETKDDLRFFLRTIGKQDKKTTLQSAFNYYFSPSTNAYADIYLSFLKIF